VEDDGQRQLPGTLRAADRWSIRSVALQEASEGCALLGCQQAVAACRVNRAQATRRASGVSYTPWLGGDFLSALSFVTGYADELYS